MSNLRHFPAEHLHEFASRVFQHFGIPQPDADQAAEILLLADLRGIDSHGIARLRSYVSMLTIGRINPTPNIRIVRESLSTATVDGDNGLGLVVGPQASAIAMDKAEHAGTGWVAVKHTNHYGIAGSTTGFGHFERRNPRRAQMALASRATPNASLRSNAESPAFRWSPPLWRT